jgi:hypothetical protein
MKILAAVDKFRGERFNIRTRPGAVWVITDEAKRRLGFFVIEETQANRIIGTVPK